MTYIARIIILFLVTTILGVGFGAVHVGDLALEPPPTHSHTEPRETPATMQPWHADYPASVAINGAMVYAKTAHQVADVEWAIDRFVQAGLELPFFEIWYHDDHTGCVGMGEELRPKAGYLLMGRSDYVVFMCGTRFTLLHELGHLWDVSALTDDVRDAFTAIRDADAWKHEVWHRAAGEHLADVMAWGLQEGTVRPSRTKPNDDASLHHAFVMATGAEPLSRRAEPGIYGADGATKQEIRIAIASFTDAGLALPQLRIYVHGSRTRCSDHPGLFNADGSGSRIDLCTNDRMVIAHELAHAWDWHMLTDATRDEFLAHVGLESWRGNSWGENGVELAATAIAAGLVQPALTASEAPDHREELMRYHLLTAHYSPRYPHPIPEAPAVGSAGDDLAEAYAELKRAHGYDSGSAEPYRKGGVARIRAWPELEARCH